MQPRTQQRKYYIPGKLPAGLKAQYEGVFRDAETDELAVPLIDKSTGKRSGQALVEVYKGFNPFQPKQRGSLQKMIAKPCAIDTSVAESPRPPAMLSGMRIGRGVELTARDLALHELLISYAYEIDKDMREATYEIPLKAVVRFLGQHTRKDYVDASLLRLTNIRVDYCLEETGTAYEGVPPLSAWKESLQDSTMICFSFPRAIRDMMRVMPRYAHIELDQLVSSLSSKYSQLIYRRLADAASLVKWAPGEPNTATVSFSPAELAELLAFPGYDDGSFLPKKLVNAINTAVNEMNGAGQPGAGLRKFLVSVELKRGNARGRPLEAITFTLTIKPPSAHVIRAKFNRETIHGIGGKDDPRYAVQSQTWLKAERAFGLGRRKVEVGNPFQSWSALNFFDLWKVSLQEAIDEKPASPGYDTASYRGESLLQIIDERGADYAAWGLIQEEMMCPDLSKVHPIEFGRMKLDAEIERVRRAGLTPQNALVKLQKAHIFIEERNKKIDQEQKAKAEAAAIPFSGKNSLDFSDCKIAKITSNREIAEEKLLDFTDSFIDYTSGEREFKLSISTPSGRRVRVSVRPDEKELDTIKRRFVGMTDDAAEWEFA